jgi:CopG family transcriptional regulator, nickel-responsive regulator
MQRITITIEDDLLTELDRHMETSGAFNRSEAVRDLMRRGLAERKTPEGTLCFGIISYAMDHSKRDLARRLPITRLDRHDQTVTAVSVPVDHGSTVDVVVMKAPVEKVTTYANALFLERGVLHGQVALIPLGEETTFHSHGSDVAHSHNHLRILGTF